MRERSSLRANSVVVNDLCSQSHRTAVCGAASTTGARTYTATPVATNEYHSYGPNRDTPLWDEERQEESGLQNGKVQNLRCAVRNLNRIFIPCGETFSSGCRSAKLHRDAATQQGPFVTRRLLMPAIGAGLCQLSNALYAVALDCDFQIVERYAHSQIVPGFDSAKWPRRHCGLELHRLALSASA
jgi:vancomycin resistance protein YoaR